MVVNVKDKQGKIVGYIEYSLRDKFGLEYKYGKYVWINDLWIYERYRNKPDILKRLILGVYEKVPSADYVYFQRTKYNKRIRQYTREEIEKNVLHI